MNFGGTQTFSSLQRVNNQNNLASWGGFAEETSMKTLKTAFKFDTKSKGKPGFIVTRQSTPVILQFLSYLCCLFSFRPFDCVE